MCKTAMYRYTSGIQTLPNTLFLADILPTSTTFLALIGGHLISDEIPTLDGAPGGDVAAVGSENLDLWEGPWSLAVCKVGGLGSDLHGELDPSAALDQDIRRHHWLRYRGRLHASVFDCLCN